MTKSVSLPSGFIKISKLKPFHSQCYAL